MSELRQAFEDYDDAIDNPYKLASSSRARLLIRINQCDRIETAARAFLHSRTQEHERALRDALNPTEEAA
jgi:hypothetical protein